MEPFFDEKDEDAGFAIAHSSSWELAPRKQSQIAHNDQTPRLTYAQAAVFEEARVKAERAALQVRQHRRSSTPSSRPSTGHSSSPSTASTASSSPSCANEEFPRHPGAFVCLKFIKGLRHPESGCQFDHPNLSAKDFAYCKRLCSFFPANNCDYRLGHKEKRFAKPDEPTCDFVHEWAYFNDATGQLVRIRPPLPEDIAQAEKEMLMQQQSSGREKAHSMGSTNNKPRKLQRSGRKGRDQQERVSNADSDAATPNGALAANLRDGASAEFDAELAEHAGSEQLPPLGLEEHISSSSSSSCSPSTTVVSLASTSRSSTISPINLHSLSISNHSPSASSTPCRFSHSQSHDFDSLPSASSMASSASSSIFSFPIPAPNAPMRSNSNLYSSQMSPVEDFDLQELATPWIQGSLPMNSTENAAAIQGDGTEKVFAAGNGTPHAMQLAGIASYDAECKLSAVPSSGLSPGALWRQLSAEDKELLKLQHLVPRQQLQQLQQLQLQAQSMQPQVAMEPPMVSKRPVSPPLPLRVPAMYPPKMSSTVATPSFYSPPGAVQRLPDPFRYLSGEVLHSLKALVNSFYPSRPEETEDFFQRLDGLLARQHVAALHPILKQLFLKRFPTQDAFVAEVLIKVRKLEEARGAEWSKHVQPNASAQLEAQKLVAAHNAGLARAPNASQVFPHVSSIPQGRNSASLPFIPPQAMRAAPVRASYPLPVAVYLPIAPVSAPLPNSSSAQAYNGYTNSAMFTPASSHQKQHAGARRTMNGGQPSLAQMHAHGSF